MLGPKTEDIVITKGDTFSWVLRWGATPFVWKAITGITAAAPAVVTATGHGVPDQWPVAIESVVGMRKINAANMPPRSVDYHAATLLTADTFSLNDVDSSLFAVYTSGGYVRYYTPVNLSTYSARMMVRPTVDDVATPLISLVSSADIALDNTLKTITVTIAAAVTAALAVTQAVYDLELVSNASPAVVTKLRWGNVIVLPEVTR